MSFFQPNFRPTGRHFLAALGPLPLAWLENLLVRLRHKARDQSLHDNLWVVVCGAMTFCVALAAWHLVRLWQCSVQSECGHGTVSAFFETKLN